MAEEKKEESKFKSIEDIIGETTKKEYTDYVGYMQNAFDNVRVDVFRKHYINSMSGDKLKEFEKMTVAQQNLELAKTDYKLTGDHTEAFTRDLALSTMELIDAGKKNWYKDAKDKNGNPIKVEEHARAMKKFMDILEDENATEAEKEHAEGEVAHYTGMVKHYIPKWDQMMATGKEQGFTRQLFYNFAKEFGQNFYGIRQMGRLKTKISEDQVNQYIKEEIGGHPDFEKFDVQQATHPAMDKAEKLIMASKYLTYKNNLAPDALDQFKEEHNKYFPKKEEKKEG